MASDQRYRVIDRLESGGMAEVFKAEALGLQGFKKQVAIKRVLGHLASKESFIKMFLDEARLSARLSHSNCVQVFDIGVGDGTYFIVMEFVDGANLRGIIDTLKAANRPFPVEEACYIAIELCKGLQYAHGLLDEHGEHLAIVHRDMSPPNVLITRHGEIKIVDFGLAKAHTQLEKSEPGIIKGKFSYLAPEAARGQEVDHRADIFAIGIMLWELLAGKRLFLGKTDLETVQMVQRSIIPPITRLRPDVPPELEPILARALASDPNQRHQTSRELGSDLNAFLYRFGQHPVSDFEIGDLVNSAMEHKRRDRENQRGTGVEQFLQWADQAVFQFESLQTGTGHAGSRALDVGPMGIASSPLGAWSASPDPRSATRGIAGLPAAGDLSALEDDDGPPVSVQPVYELQGGGGGAGGAPMQIAPGGAQSAVEANAAAAATGTAEKKGSGIVTKLAILLVALLGVIGGLLASGMLKR